MKLFLVFMGLLAGCLAQFPRPCRVPPYLTGSFEVAIQDEQLFVTGKYEYDAMGERMRLVEMGTINNVSFTYDSLMLFKEAAVYTINMKEKACVKKNLSQAFKPMAIPKDATLLAQSVLGSTSGPGEGLLVNSWMGNLPKSEGPGQYIATVTEFGCIPVSTLFHTQKTGWGVVSYFNNIIGILDPNALNPPSFCQNAVAASEEPVDFFSVFHGKH